jgi:F0F1-type ATP synthase assembly protein I
LSKGLQWATAITTIGFEMALPPLFGAWADRRFGTGPLWTILLAILGFVVAMRHLWQLAKRLGKRET